MVALINKLEEVSRDAFMAIPGEEMGLSDPVITFAERIAEVRINPVILDKKYLSQLKKITLPLFDRMQLQVYFNKSNVDKHSISLRGSTADSDQIVFFLSITGNQVAATLRMPDENCLYTIKKVQPAGKHYLFQGRITEVEKYECAVRKPLLY